MRHRVVAAVMLLLLLAGCHVCREAKPVVPVARQRRAVTIPVAPTPTATPTATPMPTPTREPTARERLLQGQPQP